MMKAETLLPLDLELRILNHGNQMEQIWLTKNQFEVLEIVARALDQTISKFLQETILSMLECELEDNVAQRLKKACDPGGQCKLMSISKIPSRYLKCPTCYKTPNYDRVQSLLTDAMAFRDSRPFNPEDPIIVSETEIYCNVNCYAIAVVRGEEKC